MVNAGAIATTSLIPGRRPTERWERLRDGLSRFAGRELALDDEVFESASQTNHRNREIARVLDGFGRIEDGADAAVELYTRQSCLSVTARDLAVMGATLADGGVNPVTHERVVAAETCRCTLAVMTTAGLYETSGDWLYEIGLPGKSGIGGGIVTVAPGKGGLGRTRRRSTRRGTAFAGSWPRASSRGGWDSTSSCRNRRPDPHAALVRRRGAALVAAPPAAAAALDDEIALAERHAPVVRLVEQLEECGPGEPYEPIDVDAALRRADGGAAGAVERRRPRRGRPDRRRPRRPATSTTSTSRATRSSRAATTSSGRAGSRMAGRRPSTPTSRRSRATRGSSRSSTGSSTPSTTGTTSTRATGRCPARLRRARRPRGALRGAGRSRLQPARGRRARRLGRREARARGRAPAGRLSGRGLARELLRRGALPRQLRRAGRRLRRHARPARRARAGGA